MRIALVAPFDGLSLSAHFKFPTGAGQLPHGYAGAPLMSVLARALVDRGHEVAAITTDYGSQLDESRPFIKVRADRMDAYFSPGRMRSFRRTSSGRRGRALDLFEFEREGLLAAIQDFAPDLIHAHWTYEFAWAALDSGIPTLTTSHDSPLKVLRFMPNLYRAARYYMARRVLSRCCHLTAVSPDLANDLRRYTQASIEVVPNPIAKRVMEAPGCSPDAQKSAIVTMVLNGWVELKNGPMALRAFALARQQRPSLQLVCYGTDWESAGLAQRWAIANGLDAGVVFRGQVPHQAVLDQMQDSAALLHPSRSESCCMVIAEAMSLGLPVIAGRDTGGVPWQLDGGRAGMLSDARNPQSMAEAILSLTGDPALWTTLSASARQRAAALFSVDSVVDRYLSLYTAVRCEQALR